MFNPQIEIIRSQASVAQEVYTFTFLDALPGLVLTSYRFQTRVSKRHKWQTQAYYGRLNPRETTLSLSEVPLPEDVQAEALNTLCAMFIVAKDYRR